MPELPELEVYAEVLRPLLTGRTLSGVEVHHHLRVLRREAADRFTARATGQRIKDVVRFTTSAPGREGRFPSPSSP